MTITADTIWDEITERAKSRFDYASFEAAFSKLSHEGVAENLLFRIIVGLAAGDSKEKIGRQIRGDFLLLGFSIDERSVGELLEHKEKELMSEVEAVRFAHSMLDQGMPPPAVREAVFRMFA